LAGPLENDFRSGTLAKQSSRLVRRGLQDLALSATEPRKRIVVADYEEPINEVIGEILTSSGYEVRTTTHPSKVVALVEDFEPQVALNHRPRSYQLSTGNLRWSFTDCHGVDFRASTGDSHPCRSATGCDGF